MYVGGFEQSTLVAEPTRLGVAQPIWFRTRDYLLPEYETKWASLWADLETLSEETECGFLLAEVEVEGVVAHTSDTRLGSGFGHLGDYPTEFRVEKLFSCRVLKQETAALEEEMRVDSEIREALREQFATIDFPNGTIAEQVLAVLPYPCSRTGTTNEWNPTIEVEEITCEIPLDGHGTGTRRPSSAQFSVDLYDGLVCDCFCRLTDSVGVVATIRSTDRAPLLLPPEASREDLKAQLEQLVREISELRKAALARGVDLTPRVTDESFPACRP